MDYMNTQPMFTNKVVIFGSRDLAELAYYYLETDSDYEVVAFTINQEHITSNTFLPQGSNELFPVIPFEELHKKYPPSEFLLFAPMTGVEMNKVRKNIYEIGKAMGYTFISYISSRATLFNNKIGDNCFILENNTIQPFTKVGNNVVLWSGNHIGHHSVIEDHVFVTSHVVVSGHCHIKERAWLGVNSTIRDNTIVGEGCLVAMGSLITKNTGDNTFWMGSPAKDQPKKADEVY